MPDVESDPEILIVTGDFHQPAEFGDGDQDNFTLGGDASLLMTMEAVLEPPELVATQT